MAETTNIKNLEQERAKFAYACAVEGISIKKEEKKISDNSYKKDEHYSSYIKNIPMYIKTNGLGSAIAFIYSKREEEKDKQGNPKDKNAYDLIYIQIKEWLMRVGKRLIDIDERDDLTKKIILLNSPEYRAVTIELLALFKWLKRFADGLDKGNGDKNNEEGSGQ